MTTEQASEFLSKMMTENTLAVMVITTLKSGEIKTASIVDRNGRVSTKLTTYYDSKYALKRLDLLPPTQQDKKRAIEFLKRLKLRIKNTV